MSIDPAVVGKRLSTARQVRGLSLQQAAEALGMASSAIAEMETGDRRPQARELYELSRLYGRQIGDLVRPARHDTNLDFVAQCHTANAVNSSATETERMQGIQRCEDFGYWYAKLAEMVGPAFDADPNVTLQDRYEALAARAFAAALISEGQLARILGTDRVSARHRIKDRLREA